MSRRQPLVDERAGRMNTRRNDEGLMKNDERNPKDEFELRCVIARAAGTVWTLVLERTWALHVFQVIRHSSFTIGYCDWLYTFQKRRGYGIIRISDRPASMQRKKRSMEARRNSGTLKTG